MKAIVVFFWENFGPMHVDRVQAVASEIGVSHRVVGLELRDSSDTYEWDAVHADFEKHTLFQRGLEPGRLRRFWSLWSKCRELGRGHYFLCHYDWTEIFVLAWVLRITGSKVTAMGCSKFDDKPRKASNELAKTFFLKPYHGAIGSGRRSRDYFRFLGIAEDQIAAEYNTVSIDRFRRNASVSRAPDIESHAERDFVCVARFVPKKNLFMVIEAYRLYRNEAGNNRKLRLCGSGPLETDLRNKVSQLGLNEFVVFEGFLQTEAISLVLKTSLCLLLPSIEEQFGNVVIEAQALGIPVIISENCGAKDILVRSGVNGFVIEPDNPEGMAWFMSRLCDDKSLWAKMADQAYMSAEQGDVARFAEAVQRRLEN